jgi:hypothetical protein
VLSNPVADWRSAPAGDGNTDHVRPPSLEDKSRRGILKRDADVGTGLVASHIQIDDPSATTLKTGSGWSPRVHVAPALWVMNN